MKVWNFLLSVKLKEVAEGHVVVGRPALVHVDGGEHGAKGETASLCTELIVVVIDIDNALIGRVQCDLVPDALLLCHLEDVLGASKRWGRARLGRTRRTRPGCRRRRRSRRHRRPKAPQARCQVLELLLLLLARGSPVEAHPLGRIWLNLAELLLSCLARRRARRAIQMVVGILVVGLLEVILGHKRGDDVRAELYMSHPVACLIGYTCRSLGSGLLEPVSGILQLHLPPCRLLLRQEGLERDPGGELIALPRPLALPESPKGPIRANEEGVGGRADNGARGEGHSGGVGDL